jgi:hypothetical protein
MFRRDLLRYAASAGVVSLVGPVARAGSDVLLSVDSRGDGSSLKQFTDADLMALPQVEFMTSTIWTAGVSTFSGPTLSSVLEAAGAVDGVLLMTAVNDYKVEVPRAIVEPNVPILANRIDGQPFGIRDKGPLWLMFPFDSDSRYQSEEVYSFSIWQLTQIKVQQE